MSVASVRLFKVLPKEHHYVLIKSQHRSNVYLVRVDPQSGALLYTDKPGYDRFSTPEQAEEHLHTLGIPQIEGSGVAVLGYVVIGHTGLLLIVEKDRTSAILPGEVTIKTIAVSKWYRIPCQADFTPLQQIEISNNIEIIENRINKIVEFPLQGAHWYSEVADVSRPFPSSYPTTQPCWQFVWNEWLSQSFRSINLGFCCPAVMEGTAESRGLRDVMGYSFMLVLLSRRSRLNPGTRYIARGLNDLCEPGNEIECEQIVWRASAESPNKILWNRYSWRRGTVPIRWGVKLRSGGLGEAEIRIKKHKTFAGCKRYIRRMQKRFSPNQDIESQLSNSSEGISNMTSRFPVVFVSLLRKGLPDKNQSETDLAAAFDKALSIMRKKHNLNVPYYSLDWHEMDKQLGTHHLISALWTTMKGILSDYGVSSGYYCKNSQADEEAPKSEWCGSNTMHWCSQQKGIARYNCADSLDRTNIASFFISVQVFIEQCRLLELAVLTGKSEHPPMKTEKPSFKDRLFKAMAAGLASTKSDKDSSSWSDTSSTNVRSNSDIIQRGELPVGWERGIDSTTGRVYYIDHVNKQTSWNLPTDCCQSMKSNVSGSSKTTKSFRTRCQEEMLSKEAWEMLDFTVDDMRSKILPEALASLAEVFLLNGDRNSFFYTGSQAMHSDKIMIFEPDTSPLKKNGIGGAGNSWIAITRRYNNVMRDSDRQAQIELFLGLNLEKHFSLTAQSQIKDLNNLNVIYKPQFLDLDFPDTDDEEEEEEEEGIGMSKHSHPSLVMDASKWNKEDPELAGLDDRRSLSSPVLHRTHCLSSHSSEEELESEEMKSQPNTVLEEAAAIAAVSHNNTNNSTSKNQECSNLSTPNLVPGIRSLPSSSHNPLAE